MVVVPVSRDTQAGGIDGSLNVYKFGLWYTPHSSYLQIYVFPIHGASSRRKVSHLPVNALFIVVCAGFVNLLHLLIKQLKGIFWLSLEFAKINRLPHPPPFTLHHQLTAIPALSSPLSLFSVCVSSSGLSILAPTFKRHSVKYFLLILV
jgi:hypothetical protein